MDLIEAVKCMDEGYVVKSGDSKYRLNNNNELETFYGKWITYSGSLVDLTKKNFEIVMETLSDKVFVIPTSRTSNVEIQVVDVEDIQKFIEKSSDDFARKSRVHKISDTETFIYVNDARKILLKNAGDKFKQK